MDRKPHYYSNPAFCQQSEFYAQKRALSPQRNVRQSPVGAQTSHVVFDNSLSDPQDSPEGNIEEQEFYEEVLVDDHGFIKGKQFVVVAQNNEGQKYIQVPQEEKRGARYGSTIVRNPVVPTQPQKSRYEYIPMQEQDGRLISKKPPLEEHIEVVPGIVHRYAVIEAEEETELTTSTCKNERYALVPVKQLVTSQTNGRYEYIQSTPPKSGSRYDYIPQSTPSGRYDFVPSPRPGTNPIATQKLHELLSTPKKTPQKVLSPRGTRRISSPPLSPITKDPFQTPKTSPRRPPTNSKAQQKLNYSIATKQIHLQEKRTNTAIVPPMCSSPVQSIYGETTFSQKSESWMNLSFKNNASGHALSIAAFIMLLCGAGTTGLSFYMLSFMGRPYYLDFSTIAGFTCALLGLLGCRSRQVHWLPNRNYLSGYWVLSLFSLLTCGGLILLLIYDPDPGTALADMTSAAICGFAVLTLLLALTGVISSYCCKYPPPDNRVQHCSPGLTV